jgi:hypothetical protein
MEATRPDPRFIAQFKVLAEDPFLNSVLNQNYNAAKRTFTLTTIAIAAMTCVGYLYTRSYSSLGIGAVVMLANLLVGRRSLKIETTIDDQESQTRLYQATEGIKEGLGYYTERKQKLGIKLLNENEKTFSGIWDAKEGIQECREILKQFNDIYNGDVDAETARLTELGVNIDQIRNDKDAAIYREILPNAIKFINNSIPYRHANIRMAAFRFIYGYPYRQPIDPDRGYLNWAILQNTLKFEAWPDA